MSVWIQQHTDGLEQWLRTSRCHLTHWGQDKMAAVSQTLFSNAYSWIKMYEFRLKFHWSLFLRFQLTSLQHWFRYWLGAVQATSHYLNQWWLVYWRIYASLGLSELRDWSWFGVCCWHQCLTVLTWHALRTRGPKPRDCTMARQHTRKLMSTTHTLPWLIPT